VTISDFELDVELYISIMEASLCSTFLTTETEHNRIREKCVVVLKNNLLALGDIYDHGKK
jgi:hypothetical protein